jgi:RHS repeat-associated protein
MYRPTGLKDQNNNTVVNNVSYNAANQLLTFNSETHTYKNLNQMTQLVITGTYPLNISYNLPAGTNNGKIASQTDNLSGETVTYQYDSLNRLITATSSQSWGETYGFDSFGNLLSKTPTGGAPTLSQSVYTSSNYIMGQNYDANGNQTSSSAGTLGYDAENRIVTVASAGVQYAYDSRNKRVWRSILSGGNLAQQVYVYGVDGQKIGTYTFTLGQHSETNVPEMTNSTVLLAQFFGHKRVGVFDRLGSAKYNQSNNQAQSFYPYGEDRGTVEPNDELKFATYTRDAATGLDYADQRYYASNFGRFMSADRYKAKPGVKDPGSWNRYSYTRSDPVNRLDPSGRFDCDPDDDACEQEPTSGPCAVGSGVGFIGDDSDPSDATPCASPQPQQKPPPTPSCSVQLWERPVPINASPAGHTYLVLYDSAWPAAEDVLVQGGPVGPPLLKILGFGGLYGYITPGSATATGPMPSSNPNLASNTEIDDITGPAACEDASEIWNLVFDYDNGPLATYSILGLVGFYNSNSFTFTLLSDVNLNGPGWQPVGWTPGWGKQVPNL